MNHAIVSLILLAVLLAGCTANQPVPPAPTPGVTVPPDGTAYGTGVPSEKALTVHFIDVGQADAILVQMPNGKSMLVDAGNPDSARTLVSYLKAHNVSALDAVVITHAHNDHIGGMEAVLRTFEVGTFVDSGYELDSEECTEMLGIVDGNHIPYRIVRAGDRIGIDSDVRIDVLNPPRGTVPLDEVNENSVVLKVRYGGVGFLLMGDAENRTEEMLLASGQELSSTFIKVGHHGSAYAATAPFLAEVEPAAAVISVGAANGYGFPAAKTLNRLSAAGSKVFRTDLDGTIVVTTDGHAYTVSCEKGCSSTTLPGYSPNLSIPGPQYTYSFTCDCSENKYNCTDFPNRTIAQACYDFCISKGKGDVYHLDSDKDGRACLY